MKVISLGWGVQSFTLAAMSALGELEPVDVALHGDTTWERQATYEFARQWTPWLEKRGMRIVQVSDKNATSITNETTNIFIPARTIFKDGKPSGLLPRQCTERWKIRPIRRWTRQQGVTQAEMWLGITVDEIERAKASQVKWIENRFPLLEIGMTRNDCMAWLHKNGLPVPPKSSCVFCPFHRRAVWREMKQANGPDWETAVKIDEIIREKHSDFYSYVHPDLIPLSEIKIADDFGATQTNFLDLFNAECDSGYCFL